MATEKFLTARSVARLDATVKRALADEREDGPNAPLARAAAAEGLPLGHVPLLVRACNTARSTCHRRSGRTTAEKAAGFPVADATEVLKALCPGRPAPRVVKAAGAAARGTARSVKAASAATAAPPRSWVVRARMGGDEGRGPDPEGLRDALAAARSEIKAAASREEEVRAARGLAVIAAAHVAGAIKRARGPSWLDVKNAARVLHGAAGEEALDLAAATSPGVVELRRALPRHSPEDYPEIYEKVAGAVGASRRWAKLAAAFTVDQEALSEAVRAAEAPAREAAARAAAGAAASREAPLFRLERRPALKSAAAGPPDGPPLFHKEAASISIPRAVAVGLLVDSGRRVVDRTLAGRGAGGGGPDRALAELQDPAHESELDRIYAGAALHSMIAHDPVLAAKDPREVARAYNEIAEAAPRLAARPVLVRPLLHKYLALGGLDSFEGGEAVKAEKAISDARRPPIKSTEGPAREAPANEPLSGAMFEGAGRLFGE